MRCIEILKVILLGVIEGVTEWLPISSTGHLLLVESIPSLTLSGVSAPFLETFEYVIQLAAILAVVFLFWGKVFPLQKNREGQLVWKKESLILWEKVFIACIPATLALGMDMLFTKLPQAVKTLSIALALIVYGALFILIEKRKRRPKALTTSEISYKHAFLIGCFQILAAIPGTSRSGVTILGALLLGVSRKASTEFTFFLAIPTMVGASAYKLLIFFIESGGFTTPELGYLLIGSTVAFTTSLAAVKFLIGFVEKHDFRIFGWYRILLGVVVLFGLVLPPLFA